MKSNLKFYVLSFLVLFVLPFAMAKAETMQGKVIKGKVVDETKMGMIGVNITVKGTTIGTITDYDGNYSISVPDSKSVLLFSFIGYQNKEVTVGNQSVINVSLSEDAEVLDEVVVVGYGTARKGDVTGAITSVRPDEKDAAKVVSVDNLLQGKVAGLAVNTSSAAPGAASSVTIRGANSLRGDNQPLYVIDNVPQASTGEFAASAFGDGDFQIAQNPLTSLNPQDIEDIQILKDASATAIYGSRGANGVILITTKKGKSGKVKVGASANFTIANATRLIDMLSLREYADFKNQKAGETAKQFFFVGDEIRYVFSGNTANYDENDPSTYNVLQNRDWQDEVYRSAFSQNYSVNLNGGSDKVTYFISAAYKDIQGIASNTGLKQGDLRMNLSAELSKTVKMNFSLNGSIKSNDMMSGGDTKGGVTGSLVRTALDSAPYLSPSNEPNLNEEQKTTVWSWINDYEDETNEKTFRGSLDLTWQICKNLSYNLRTGGNIFMQDRSRWFGLQLFKGQNENGSLGITDLNRYNFNVENLLNYNFKVHEVFDLGATVGVTYDDYNMLNKVTLARNFQNHAFRTNGLHWASEIIPQQPIQKDYQLLSYLARLNMSFLEGRYLLTATFRADGTSKFKEGNRWAYFPSVNLGWRMEQEDFIKENAPWIDQLKIRLGYGQTGNQSIDPYSSFYDYQKVIDYAYTSGDKALALAASKLQNNGLKWERTLSYNGGIDFGFFNNRLSGTVDVYYKETRDLLVERLLPPSVGFPSVLMNQGSLSNKGVELTLDGDVIRGKNFTWNIGGNIGFNTPKIKKLGLPESQYGNETYSAYLGNSIGDHFGVANIFIEGKAPGLFWGYKTDGIVQEGEVLDYTSTIVGTVPGNVKYVDATGDGVLDENDKVIIGNPNTKFTYGFQTSFTYKDLTLSASFNGVYGNEILNANLRYEAMPSTASSSLRSDAFKNAWTPENQSNLYPSVTSKDSKIITDRFIEDGSFLRCSDITLSYSLPKSIVKKIGFGSINVFASGKNLFLVTGYSGYDPEVNTFAFDGLRPGIDLNSFPNSRQFIFGLNVSF